MEPLALTGSPKKSSWRSENDVQVRRLCRRSKEERMAEMFEGVGTCFLAGTLVSLSFPHVCSAVSFSCWCSCNFSTRSCVSFSLSSWAFFCLSAFSTRSSVINEEEAESCDMFSTLFVSLFFLFDGGLKWSESPSEDEEEDAEEDEVGSESVEEESTGGECFLCFLERFCFGGGTARLTSGPVRNTSLPGDSPSDLSSVMS